MADALIWRPRGRDIRLTESKFDCAVNLGFFGRLGAGRKGPLLPSRLDTLPTSVRRGLAAIISERVLTQDPATMTSSSPITVMIIVDLAEAPLVENMSRLHETLAKSDDDPISVYIFSEIDNDHPLSSTLESVALRSMIGVLRNNVDRIDDLQIDTEYRSSLRDIWVLVHSLGRGLASATTLFYKVDDCPGGD